MFTKLKLRKVSIFLMSLLCLITMSSCDNKKNDSQVSYSDKGSVILLENANIRIKFNKNCGSINELFNKKSNLYLVEDNDSEDAITIKVRENKRAKTLMPNESSFKYEKSDIDGGVVINFSWSFENGVQALASVTLLSSSDEIIFNTELKRLDGETISVSYPIIDNVNSLSENGDNDYLISPMATGYLFQNPAKNFSRYGQDLTGQSALYPSGFGATMQFMSYYTANVGGFYWHTKDSSDTVKDFIVCNDGGTLQFEIGHYVDDLSLSSKKFKYDTIISNTYEGNWYEAAEKYKTWAITQPWATMRGKNSERTDINKALYEESVLCNFIAPSRSTQESAADLYNVIRNNLKQGKMVTIPFYYSIKQEVFPNESVDAYFNTHKNKAFYDAIEKNGELVAFFEYEDLHKETSFNTLPNYIRDSKLINIDGNPATIDFAERWGYICASNSQWTNLVLNRQKEQFTKLGAEGIYNDLGICAVHPLNCYDDNHEHGSRINILQDYYHLMNESYKISREVATDSNGNPGFTGQEMITEQVIPYVDLYQARSSAGEMSGMEHDAIMKLVQNDVAIKVPLFEYIYHEYCGIRADGFTLPITTIGTPYYHTMAYVALNGGLPEFNYECYDHEKFAELVKLFDTDMIEFVDKLGQARLSYGKDFLVYGAMARTPNLNIQKEEFYYETPIVINWGSVGGLKKGNILIDPIVRSAYTNNDQTAIFLCNVTDADRELNFTIDALNLYGIDSGTVSYVCDNNEVIQLGDLSDGKIDISLKLNSRSIYMIIIE